MEFPKRKRTRMAGYDYSTPRKYFVTICSYQKKCILSEIIATSGIIPSKVVLTPYGNELRKQIGILSNRYEGCIIENYVIMPNHVHILIDISQCNERNMYTISDIICGLKSLTTKACRKITDGVKIFQSSFHDHIIRNDADYKKIYDYIISNPEKWADDMYNEGKENVGQGFTPAE